MNPHLIDLHKEAKHSVKTLEIRQRSKRYPHNPYTGQTPDIPHPQLFESPTEAQSDLPKAAGCAIHLELLEAFFTLRVKVLNCQVLDETFGIAPQTKKVYRQAYSVSQDRHFKEVVRIRDDFFRGKRIAKWGFFLEIAVGRFLGWLDVVDQWMESWTVMVDPQLPACLLPPLDILMVWHAFLLNPRDFETFCAENQWQKIRTIPFPWSDIHQTINSDDWHYRQSEASQDWLLQTAGIEPDLYAYLVLARNPESPTKPKKWSQEEESIKPKSLIADLLSNYGSLTKSAPFVATDYSKNKLTSTDQVIIDIRQESSYLKEFILPLKENVERQMKFVETMHAQLWIRSPAVQGTLNRAVDRYTKFVELFEAYPGSVLVPTIDIDLVWHTHQASATEYQRSMINRTGRFVDHNDKIGKPILSGGLEKTAKLFTERFGETYTRCLCWDCEASTSAFDNSDGDVDDEVIDLLVKKVQDDLEYYRLVELTRRNGGPLPVRQ